MELIYEIFTASWSFYLEASVYMLFGFLAAGVLHVLFKPDTISKYLGRGKYRSVVLSALAGIRMVWLYLPSGLCTVVGLVTVVIVLRPPW